LAYFSRSQANLNDSSSLACLQDYLQSLQPSQLKLFSRMHPHKTLTKFNDHWPWPTFQGHRPIWM